MKKLVFVLLSAAAIGASAEIVYTEENPPPRKAFKDRTPEEQVAFQKFMVQHRQIKTGGDIILPGAYQGKVMFVDAQTRFTETTNVIAYIKTMIKLPLGYAKSTPAAVGDPAAVLGAHKANVVVIIVDDTTTPAILAAPEDHWVKFNVAKLEKGLEGPLASRIFNQRCRKELLRAFAYACGGIASQFPRNIMETAKVEDLDLVTEFIPVDHPPRYEAYLKGIGVTTLRTTSYIRACMDGWAPAPTNKYQKAIWDQVHALPSDPIKIKYDPKRDK